VAFAARNGRFAPGYRFFIRSAVAPYAKLVKGSLHVQLVHIAVARVARVALVAMAHAAFYEYRSAGRFASLMMADGALASLLCLMREIG
jgi:hypothetical protein